MAALGPFFVIDRLDDRPSWRPMREFATDPAGLVAVLSSVRRRLQSRAATRTDSGIGQRAAASVGFLGLAARLLSPTLGVLAGSGMLPDLDWDALWWRPNADTQVSLAAGAVTGASVTGPDDKIGPAAVAAVQQMAIRPVLDLGSVVTDRYGVSPLIIRGNVASAVFGTGTVIAASAAARQDRTVGDRAKRLVADLLAQPELSGAGSILPGDGSPTFRRRSCCLLYRVPDTQLCGDCVLRGR